MRIFFNFLKILFKIHKGKTNFFNYEKIYKMIYYKKPSRVEQVENNDPFPR